MTASTPPARRASRCGAAATPPGRPRGPELIEPDHLRARRGVARRAVRAAARGAHPARSRPSSGSPAAAQRLGRVAAGLGCRARPATGADVSLDPPPHAPLCPSPLALAQVAHAAVPRRRAVGGRDRRAMAGFSEPVTGFELEDLVVGNGSVSELQGNNATYTAAITPEASGAVTVDIAAGAAEDSAGNPSAAANQFSITTDLTPMPALPPGRRDRNREGRTAWIDDEGTHRARRAGGLGPVDQPRGGSRRRA